MTALPAPVLGVFGLGTTEILVILFIVLLLFGAKKLPELAKGLGKSMNEFKRASKDAETEDEKLVAKAPESSKPHNS